MSSLKSARRVGVGEPLCVCVCLALCPGVVGVGGWLWAWRGLDTIQPMLLGTQLEQTAIFILTSNWEGSKKVRLLWYARDVRARVVLHFLSPYPH